MLSGSPRRRGALRPTCFCTLTLAPSSGARVAAAPNRHPRLWLSRLRRLPRPPRGPRCLPGAIQACWRPFGASTGRRWWYVALAAALVRGLSLTHAATNAGVLARASAIVRVYAVPSQKPDESSSDEEEAGPGGAAGDLLASVRLTSCRSRSLAVIRKLCPPLTRAWLWVWTAALGRGGT